MKYALTTLIYIAVMTVQAQDYMHPSATDPGYLGESNRFMFFENYWLNMQHWAYNMSAYAQEEPLEHVMGEVYAQLSDQDREALLEAVRFYQEEILQYDLRIEELTYYFKRWIVTQDSGVPEEVPQQFRPIMDRLIALKPIYDQYYWDTHHQANVAVYEDNIDLIRTLEDTSVVDLEWLCRARWQEEKIRVDISYHSKLSRPYTTVTPVAHIVMDSRRNATPVGNWFELLLHETSHHMIDEGAGFIGGTILDVGDKGNYRLPGQLSHSYLFYLSGKIAQRHLADIDPDYQLYVIRRGIFKDRIELLPKYLDPYIAGELSLHDATRALLEDYWENP